MLSPDAGREPAPLLRWLLAGATALALIASGWALTRHWHGSLRDAHEFRQLQTALSTYYFRHEGLRLAYETPVLGPPWSIPMEFPLYQAAVAQASALLGQPLEESGRLVSVLCFYAALPAAWLLLRRRLPAAWDTLPVMAALLLCPLYLFYSRAFMIESMALAFTAWFTACVDRALDGRHRGWLVGAWIFGALAALTKVTTFAAFWIACGLLVLERIQARRRAGEGLRPAVRRVLPVALGAAAAALLAGAVWVVYSDRLKEQNPYGHFLTSGALRAFNLGSVAQRASLEWWRGLGYVTAHSVLAWPGLAVTALGLWLAPSAHRRLTLACLLSYPGGAILFANLYYVHDYYSYASAGFLAAALGVASAGLLRSPRLPPLIAALLVLGGLGGQFLAFHGSYYRFFHEHETTPIPDEAALIRAVTPPGDVFAGFGFDWNSLLPYYAERRAIMPFASHTGDFAALDRSLAALGARRVATLLVARAHREDHALTDVLIGKLGMCPKPLARTEAMDLYVRRDRAAAAVQALAAKPDWHAELNLKPADNVIVLEERQDLAALPWIATLANFTPRPALAKGKYPINYLDAPAGRVVFTQAPTEIHFRPPPGSRSVDAVTGMLPSSYTPPNDTAGVLVSVFEELPDGTRHVLFERLLMPLTEPKDRGDVVIHYTQDLPFTGMLVFAHYPVPSGNINYSWSYWQSVQIR